MRFTREPLPFGESGGVVGKVLRGDPNSRIWAEGPFRREGAAPPFHHKKRTNHEYISGILRADGVVLALAILPLKK